MSLPSRLERPPGDRLRMAGADTLDLLHRLAATSLRDLAPGQTRRAVFCDDRGRVIDVPLVVRPPLPSTSDQQSGAVALTEQAAVELIASHHRGPELRRWLERWVITEDVRFDGPDPGRLCSLHGDLDRLPETLGTSPFEGRVQASGAGSWVAAGPGENFAVVWMAEETLQREILDASEPIAAELMRAILLDRGGWIDQPASVGNVNALELGLRAWIDFDKGCYIGQEVIARLNTYEKVRRRPAVLCLENNADPHSGADLRHQERRAGYILDAARDGEGRVWALAVVDRELESGAELTDPSGKAGKIMLFPAPFGSTPSGSSGPVTRSSGPTPS